VAVPLEMLLDSGRHILAALAVFALRAFGAIAGGASHVSRHLTGLIQSIYDVYVAIPLRIESMIRDGRNGSGRGSGGSRDVPTGPQPREGVA
jgi:hypothetical protein